MLDPFVSPAVLAGLCCSAETLLRSSSTESKGGGPGALCQGAWSRSHAPLGRELPPAGHPALPALLGSPAKSQPVGAVASGAGAALGPQGVTVPGSRRRRDLAMNTTGYASLY